jgi:hypothetical protein
MNIGAAVFSCNGVQQPIDFFLNQGANRFAKCAAWIGDVFYALMAHTLYPCQKVLCLLQTLTTTATLWYTCAKR